MLTIDTYLRPAAPEEAYALSQKKNHTILGGMLWLRQENHRLGSVIDLSRLGWDQVEDTGDAFRLGTYVTLRQMETHPALNTAFSSVFQKAFAPIVGVQFRNLATLGGSVYGRFGFSDVLTVLLALEARVCLYHAGTVPLRDFCDMPHTRRSPVDLLTHIEIPKGVSAAAVEAHRNAATDFPVLNVCAARRDDRLTVTVGARPLRAVPYTFDLPACPHPQNIADAVAEQVVLASNSRASEAYRRHLCRVLVRRAVAAVCETGGQDMQHTQDAQKEVL